VETTDIAGQMHAMWASVAGSWQEHADYVDARAASVTARMLERSAPRPGERVLELACGPGGLGLAAARLVAPNGEVVMSDVVAEMTAIAAARAGALGLDNVRTCELDLERINQTDASYDVVLCRDGLMFALDPAQALREMRRVLRPGGRLAVVVWGPRARNPWLAVLLDAVSAQLGAPVPPPGLPGPFALDDADLVTRLLQEAALDDVVVDEISTPLRADSFDDWWSRTTALAGPMANILTGLPDEAASELRTRLLAAVQQYETPSGLEFPGVNLLATGRRR
jgi:ubiquinone/menaquinone biosynthesis C-methylase UbiE